MFKSEENHSTMKISRFIFLDLKLKLSQQSAG